MTIIIVKTIPAEPLSSSFDWDFAFSIDPSNEDCITVHITGDDMSPDKDDIPKIQQFNSELAEIVCDIYDKEYPFGEEED